MFNKQEKEPALYSSKTDLVIQKYLDLIKKEKINTEELTEEKLTELINSKPRLLLGESIDSIINQAKNKGLIKKAQPQQAPKPEPITHETQYQKLGGIINVADSDYQIILEQNKFWEELDKNIFKNEKELDIVYNLALNLNEGEDNQEEIDEKYYLAFAEIGKIVGGQDEVMRDLASYRKTLEIFKEKENSLTPEEKIQFEKNKKIATIVEKGIALSVTKLGWFGENISITPASKFNDVKRGVDDVMEVKTGNNQDYLALAIDVTYNGLYSEKYKQKIFRLLNSISENKKTKIKYHKNSTGEMMEEFAIPKIVLHFDFDDVKDLIALVKNKDNPAFIKKFKSSPKRLKAMNQIIILCEEFSHFAEESQNDIFRQYLNVISSIKELSWNDEELREVIMNRHDDITSIHIKKLILEFKDLQKAGKYLENTEDDNFIEEF
jgi:hypothetical protein